MEHIVPDYWNKWIGLLQAGQGFVSDGFKWIGLLQAGQGFLSDGLKWI